MSNLRGQTIKVVILGDSGVGKSSLALRFVSNEFKPYSESTIGASYMSKSITVQEEGEKKEKLTVTGENDGEINTNEENSTSETAKDAFSSSKKNNNFIPPSPTLATPRRVEFKIWDTAGQEKYRSLAPMYYRGAGAALLVYDITKPESFHILQSWVNELKYNGPPGIVMGLCGNKCDLVNENETRHIDVEEAHAYAKSLGCFYMETSAKDDVNVYRAFEELAKRVPYVEEENFDFPERGGYGNLDLGQVEEESLSFFSSWC